MRVLTLLDDPDFFRSNPGAQRSFMDDYTHRYCALAGGWFAGKTVAGARLRAPRARFLQFMVTFTHEGDDTRVYRDFELEPKPDHVLYRTRTLDNPHARAFDDVQRQQLSAELASQYLDGIASSTGGHRMYSSFDAARNVDDSLAISPNAPLQIAVDFNINPGMHCLIGQHFHHQDLLTTIHEIHEPRMDVKRMVHALRPLIEKQLPTWQWTSPLQIFGDASGTSQWAGVGQSCYDILLESLRIAGVPFQLRVPRSNPHLRERAQA